MEHKAFPLAAFKVDASSGEFSGYASVFGNEDAGGDIVEPGAFTKAIPAFLRDGFISWSHDWATPIALPTDAREDERGLLLSGRFHSTPTAQEARTIAAERAAAGKRTGLSVGYGVEDWTVDKQGRRRLKVINPLYEVGFVMVPMNREANLAAVKAAKAAIAPHSTATDAGAWDGPANEARLPTERAALRTAHAWVDAEGDPDIKASYRFIHHTVPVGGDVGGANLTACSTGIGILNGGRGGTTIPEADHAGVWRHLARHLRDGDMEPPELRGLSLDSGLSMAASVARILGDVSTVCAKFEEMTDLRLKVGRTLSAANLALIDELITGLQRLREAGDRARDEADDDGKAVRAALERARFLGVKIKKGSDDE